MEVAKLLFEAYNAQAGGLTFDGRPIPPFEEVGEKVQQNWQAVAELAEQLFAEFDNPKTDWDLAFKGNILHIGHQIRKGFKPPETGFEVFYTIEFKFSSTMKFELLTHVERDPHMLAKVDSDTDTLIWERAKIVVPRGHIFKLSEFGKIISGVYYLLSLLK